MVREGSRGLVLRGSVLSGLRGCRCRHDPSTPRGGVGSDRGSLVLRGPWVTGDLLCSP